MPAGATAADGAGPAAAMERVAPIHLLAFFFAALFFCYAFVQRIAPSVMIPELMREFGVGAAALGNLAAFYFYVYASLQIPIGVLLDRFGPRRLMTFACTGCAVGSLIFAWSESVAAASLGRALVGGGAAFSFVGGLALVSLWFPARRFGLLTGLCQFGGMVGAVLGAAPTAALVAGFGWRQTMVIFAVWAAAMSVMLWLTARDGPRREVATSSLLQGLRTATGNRQTWLAAGYGFSLAGPLLAFGGLWAVPYVIARYGIDRATAAAIVSLSFVGYGLSAPLVGAVSDRLGRRRPMLAGAALGSLTMAAIVWLPGLSLWAMAILVFVNGVVSATMMLGFVSSKEHNPPSASGAAVGIVNTAVMTSGALLQPLIGWLLDLAWTGESAGGIRLYAPEAFRTAFTILPAWFLFGLLLAWLLREPRRA